ncbi:TPA: DUF1320 family protein [Pasteurella multocida]|uniref:gp436 family protein n=1 Tax=Pasteurella multocida TaxID=747 RepID=UPI0029AD11FF|nr:DUF1320 family protein [Pasteurella multocida]HEH9669012.1 DUF1320 family protein [Pasteurella multocida]HEH9696367.1 DUF1320 family protein [Pasteurella multocida]HEH9727314.1 DUF1320 family protein [Pasteurella multocida]HEH9752603.1 DUF1320 family protein [Pasteurella multocida]
MYAQLADLIRLYGEQTLITLTDREMNQELKAEVAEFALADASQTIDSYIGGRVDLPLKSPPVVLNRHCCVIARYFLESHSPTDPARKEYEDSLKFLRDVASGLVTLGLDKNAEVVENENLVQFEAEPSVWGRKQAKGFI